MRLKEIKEDMIIHCKTQEEANMLCEALGAEDKWKAYWKYAEDETCYHIHSNDICCYGKISSFTRKITEFSDLVIPDLELSAEEALLAYDQMCRENYCCNPNARIEVAAVREMLDNLSSSVRSPKP